MTRILFVEDDNLIISNLTQFLNNEGFWVKNVTGQSAAMRFLEEEMVDLVLMDVSLAEGNGFALETRRLSFMVAAMKVYLYNQRRVFHGNIKSRKSVQDIWQRRKSG